MYDTDPNPYESPAVVDLIEEESDLHAVRRMIHDIVDKRWDQLNNRRDYLYILNAVIGFFVGILLMGL